jgi:hypothetical protein
MQDLQATNTEAAIWSRLFRPTAKTLSVEAARSILRLEFTQEDKDRMHALAAKAREGSITSTSAICLPCGNRKQGSD